MKVLQKKMKKIGKASKIFYFFTIIAYLLSLIYFIITILQFKGIENVIRIAIIVFFSIWFAIYALGGLISMVSKKKVPFVIMTIITLLICPVFCVSSFYVNKVFNTLSNIRHDKITYSSNLISLKETKFDDSAIIGMIESEEDVEGNQLAKKLIKKEQLSNKIETFEDYHSMLTSLYDGKIDACFVSSNYKILFGSEDQFPNIADDVKVVYEYNEEMVNKDNEILKSSADKKLTEPFTMLVMGVDSEKNGLTANQAFNGDTLIMITFNPDTLTATMFSMPRDMYVPIACNHNRYAKINSSAAYGSTCVISTLEQITGIEIDYYVKMNFKGVVDLVNALGGVTVDVEEPDFWYDDKHQNQVCEQDSNRNFGNSLVCMKTGKQKLNGEQALAYARCRHLYAISDIARNRHQQDIIEAMAQKLKKLNSINDFEKILNAVSNNLETNMTKEQILSLYDVGKDMLANTSKDSTALSIKKTHLAYYSLPVYLPASGMYTSALGYYQQSLDAIVNAMKVNLGLKSEKTIKTFSISYNEEYTTPLIGQGLTGGKKLERMPSFIGYDKSYVSNWCASNSITCNFESVESANEIDQIIDQTVHEGELLKTVKTVTFKISNGQGSVTTDPETTDDPEVEDPTDPENPDDEESQDSGNDETDENQKPEDKTPDEESPNIPGTPDISQTN